MSRLLESSSIHPSLDLSVICMIIFVREDSWSDSKRICHEQRCIQRGSSHSPSRRIYPQLAVSGVRWEELQSLTLRLLTVIVNARVQHLERDFRQHLCCLLIVRRWSRPRADCPATLASDLDSIKGKFVLNEGEDMKARPHVEKALFISPLTMEKFEKSKVCFKLQYTASSPCLLTPRKKQYSSLWKRYLMSNGDGNLCVEHATMRSRRGVSRPLGSLCRR